MRELIIAGQSIKPGERRKIELPTANLYTDTNMSLPVCVIRGRLEGPTVFISAAIHGDELNGIEIVRRLINRRSLRLHAGSLILVPVVNVYGVLNKSRYMPDRRDLNRTFPGSEQGSLAGRVAHRFFDEIVAQSNYGIDLHTGAVHRSNIPQIRANLDDDETRRLAEAFNVPVLINADLRDGSLRQAAVDAGVKVLLYEAGEALRFDELSIRAGLSGILNVLAHLGMIKRNIVRREIKPFVAYSTTWLRAPCSGIIKSLKDIGDSVEKGECLAEIGTLFGEVLASLNSSRAGIIVGKQVIPLVQEGEAMFHIASFARDNEKVAEHIELMHDVYLPDE
jgi:predicted deacylase